MRDLRSGLFLLGGRQDLLRQNVGHRVPRRVRSGFNVLDRGNRPLHNVSHVRREQVLHRSVHHDNHLDVRGPRRVL